MKDLEVFLFPSSVNISIIQQMRLCSSLVHKEHLPISGWHILKEKDLSRKIPKTKKYQIAYMMLNVSLTPKSIFAKILVLYFLSSHSFNNPINLQIYSQLYTAELQSTMQTILQNQVKMVLYFLLYKVLTISLLQTLQMPQKPMHKTLISSFSPFSIHQKDNSKFPLNTYRNFLHHFPSIHRMEGV